MTVLLAKRGFISPGSGFLRDMERFGATDAWDFVGQSYLRAGVVGPSGITFTRASVGYAERSDGIWQSFASGVARITDKGILIEGSRINRALYSRDLTNAAWTATNVTVARNQVGIDGTANSACSLTATAGNGTVLQAVTNASTGRYFSIWVKRITGTGTVEVTLDNGSTWTAVTVTSGWTRVGAAQTLANPTVGVRIVTSGDAIAVDFAQLEDGAFPSSPILVEGTAVTRAADAATAVPTAGTDYPLTLFAEFERVADAGATQNVLRVDAGNGDNRANFYIGSSDDFRAGMVAATMPQGDVGVVGATAINTVYKAAARYGTNTIQAARGGTLAIEDTSATAPSAPTRWVFGADSFLTSGNLFGYLRRVALFPRDLTNDELQGITT